jgi:hypothetical protein
MVLAAHQRERAQHEDPCEVHQRSDRAISARGVTGDDLEVERQGDEHQAGHCSRRTADCDEKVVPLLRSICVCGEHLRQDRTEAGAEERSRQ